MSISTGREHIAIMPVVVDDLLVICTSNQLATEVVERIGKEFQITSEP